MAGPGFHFLGEEEFELVREVLRSRELCRYRFDDDAGGTSKVYTLEREVEQRFAARHCIAVNSGTSALLAALVALGVGPGDEVIVPGYTFIASIAAIAHRGAIPVLAEIDDSLTIDPADVEDKITPATRAILAVHMLGASCDLAALQRLADEHGLLLIEDVAQACGGRYRGRALGTVGAAGAFSLNLFKVITSGDGGWLTVSDTDVYERAFAFHDHGFKPFGQRLMEADSVFGLNLRMTELTGAVALGQFRKLDRILDHLRHQRARLVDALGTRPGIALRRSNDPDGDCATSLALTLSTSGRARAVAEQLGTSTLLASGRHYYGNMSPLLARRGITDVACPFACAAHPTTRRYEPGMLPRTDELLSRTIALSVGVTDSYLGTGFGITVHSGEAEIGRTADLVAAALEACRV